MENLKWVKEDKNYILKNDEVAMVNLSISLAKGSSFIIHDKQYQISRKSFWKTGYLVRYNDKEILTLSDNFWGSNGKILFNDGTVYSINFKTKGGLKMRFMDGENEILSYTTAIENKKNVIVFSIGTATTDAEKLLILSALGMMIFTISFGDDASGDDILLLTSIAAIA